MNPENQKRHDALRHMIEGNATCEAFAHLSELPRLALSAICLANVPFLRYGAGIRDGRGGSYYARNTKDGQAATFAYRHRTERWPDQAPGLECGGFVEAAIYMAGIHVGGIISYRNVRTVPRETKFFQEASGGDEDYSVNWVPSKDKLHTIFGDAGFGMTWAPTPVLIFHNEIFMPRPQHEHPKEGEIVCYMSKDTSGFHYHVGIWAYLDGVDGLVHSSPLWPPNSVESGPKFTAFDSDYYRWLGPQRKMFEGWFGASIVTLRGEQNYA